MNRERIEEIREKRFNTVITAEELCQLCTLALRGLGPMVEWVEDEHEKDFVSAQVGKFSLQAWHNGGGLPDEPAFEWSIYLSNDYEIANDFADSLEAAQKAAEDALAKLVGGEG